MQILLVLLKKYWKYLVLALVLWFLYTTIYNMGVQDTNANWEVRIEKQEKLRDEQITQIESLAKVTLEQTLINNLKVNKDLRSINLKIGTTTIKDGECIPSKEFIDTFNTIISKGNSK